MSMTHVISPLLPTVGLVGRMVRMSGVAIHAQVSAIFRRTFAPASCPVYTGHSCAKRFTIERVTMRVRYRYCPVCAQPLKERRVFGRPRSACASCGFVHFEEPKVAVAMVIRDDQDQVLLVKRGVEPGIGLWAVPSGFLDSDEEPRQAAMREVREETGLETSIGRILDALPIRHEDTIEGVTIFFDGRPIGGTLRPADDVSEARWVSLFDLGCMPMAFPDTLPLILNS